ncbi:MAG: hypothetical protein EOM19_03570 [Candidatus Moranbacteria bacterium]|nr:hypothetical protein [Candidatus Moranbacteria bacterium]
MKNLYLDIDGVLLTKQGVPALHLVEFLTFTLQNFDCYWLTTHCKGDASTALFHISSKVPPEAIPFLEKIKPTTFNLWKTEGIDFSQDSLWLDDYAFDGEKNVLKDHQALQNLILINLKSRPDHLLETITLWKEQGV